MLASDGHSEETSERERMDDLPLAPGTYWVDVCRVDRITPGTGLAALIEGEQIAVIRGRDGQSLYALSNFDPFSKAFVIARGIIGDRDGIPKIASPIFKQSFDLRTGQCLDDPEVRLPVFPTRLRDGNVQVLVARRAP